MLKKILCMALVAVMCLMLFAGCNEKASDYTEEEHLARVTERIENRFMTDETEYTSFSVYPLYNKSDVLEYFLVEFEPFGFVYVLLCDEQLKVFSWLGASTSMYSLSNADEIWYPYTIDETNSQPYPDTNKIWQVDDNGNKIEYNSSPFKIAYVEDEKKYLLQTEIQSSRPDVHHKSTYYIPAVKTDKGFLNLISKSAFDESDILYENLHATQYIPFIAKKHFDL